MKKNALLEEAGAGRFPKGNAITPTVDVLVHDPGAIDTLREGGKNTLYITWMVWLQLNTLRNRPEIGIDAKECINRIEQLRKDGDPSLVIWKDQPSYNGINFLDKNDPAHQVIATAISIKEALKPTKKYRSFKFISRDAFSRTTAREIDNNGLIVESYNYDRVEVKSIQTLKEVEVIDSDFYTAQPDVYLLYKHKTFGELDENEGVLCHYDGSEYERKLFAAIKKGHYLEIIPENISAFGIRPKPLQNGEINWAQYVAFQQLLDPSIRLVHLEGCAGTGKTLLALACALEQKNIYTQIALTRPMVHLEDQDNMGFLPGKINEKMDPWLRPLWMALQFLIDQQKSDPKKVEPKPKKEARLNDASAQKKVSKTDKRKERREKREDNRNQKMSSSGTVEEMRFRNKIIIEPLDTIRGMSFPDTYLILDEGQNTTPHTIKTIITRASEGTKIVITGDLSQVDLKKLLDKNSNGLAHSMANMKKHEIFATTRFGNDDSVRSLLAKLGAERL